MRRAALGALLLALAAAPVQAGQEPFEVVEGAGGSVTVGAPVRQVRLTYYVLRGGTYSGTPTRPGVAACSWDLAIGTRLRFPDGWTVVCEDRGSGLGHGAPTWIDVWVASVAEGRALAATYGPTVTLEILR